MMPCTNREMALQFWGMASMRDAIAYEIEWNHTMILAKEFHVTEEEAREVLEAWDQWYSRTPWPLSWAKVREAIIRRSENEKWQP